MRADARSRCRLGASGSSLFYILTLLPIPSKHLVVLVRVTCIVGRRLHPLFASLYRRNATTFCPLQRRVNATKVVRVDVRDGGSRQSSESWFFSQPGKVLRLRVGEGAVIFFLR